MRIMRGGRACWKIENETFNTLENQGNHFEHNFGHGYRHLSTVLMHLIVKASCFIANDEAATLSPCRLMCPAV